LIASTRPSYTGRKIRHSISYCIEPVTERATPADAGRTLAQGSEMSIAVLSTNRPHLVRQARLHWDPVREQQVLLAPEGVLVLNQTGATILGLCDGERTVVEIVEELSGRYSRVADDEVRDFLARLVDKRWVELGDE